MVSSRPAIACILLSLSVAVCAHAQSPTKEQPGSISGRVTFKSKGLAGVVVVAVPNNYSGGSEGRPRYRATTDDEGNYRISDVPAGNYVAYPLAPALAVDIADAQPVLTIATGQALRDVNFAMMRGGVITGRITNADGQPLVEESVSVAAVDPPRYYPTYNFRGIHTDDRGVYRAFGLRPGKYRVSVGQQKGLPGFTQQTTRQTFYPSVTEIDKATVIEVTEGSEAVDINIVAAGLHSTFSVSGRIIDSAGTPVPGASLGIHQSDGNSSMSSTGGNATNSKGEFKIQNVLPGKYTLFFAPPENSDLRADPIEFEVIDSDLTGLEFKTKRGASLSGMVVVEGPYETSLAALFKGLRVFVALDNTKFDFETGPRSVEIGPDGSFRMVGIGSGNARLNFLYSDDSQAEKFEIQHLEQNGTLLPSGISIKEGEQVTGLRLVVKYLKLTGVMRGVVKIENGELSPDARVLVWVTPADPSRAARISPPSPQVDSRGQFLLERLAAGTYDVRAALVEPGGRRLGPTSPKQVVVVADNTVTDVTLTIKLKP
ncbi:MAG TPA: carboxypeptidase-like regulatory domain-containing protein [Pyrinomonadaceae bacterium]